MPQKSKTHRFDVLQVIVHIGAWMPLIWLAWLAWSGNLTANPIQAAEQRTGRYALYLLVLSLACTPLNTVFAWRQALSVRRALGLYAFFYATIHLLIFTGLDYGFDLSLLPQAVFEKNFIIIGVLALLILAALAATSFKSSMKKLGKGWKRLHQLVYLAAVLILVHYAWSLKSDPLRLRGDVSQPVIFTGLVVLLLAMRIPSIRRLITLLRSRLANLIAERWKTYRKIAQPGISEE